MRRWEVGQRGSTDKRLKGGMKMWKSVSDEWLTLKCLTVRLQSFSHSLQLRVLCRTLEETGEYRMSTKTQEHLRSQRISETDKSTNFIQTLRSCRQTQQHSFCQQLQWNEFNLHSNPGTRALLRRHLHIWTKESVNKMCHQENNSNSTSVWVCSSYRACECVCAWCYSWDESCPYLDAWRCDGSAHTENVNNDVRQLGEVLRKDNWPHEPEFVWDAFRVWCLKKEH